MARSPNFYILMLPLYCQVFVNATLNVSQTPTNLSVTKGDNASITCSWEAEDQDERIRVWWKIYYESASAAHDGTVLASLIWTNNKSEVRIRSRNQSDYQLTKDKAKLWLFFVNESDAGTYICEITIDKPDLRSGKGKGTTLYVTDSVSSPTALANIAYLAVFLILVTVILLGYLLYKRRKKENIHLLHQRAPEAVQLNEIHENMNDGEDSSSSNSVRWAVSTLYESCDYFAMKTPETPEGAVYSLAL
ncbi:uncharacterized protein LOC108696360 isoform X2 [Xenopus laevis]|uniref:Uncharacterized protein LOC108696360 isoform X2 n=1 Tax=Xenopus laevis TaxID=8355 RepID=A0A8J1MPR4_XENLA|nr:uncharacterized protein LOC108696360 isoform X2 [Xenopus laevis]